MTVTPRRVGDLVQWKAPTHPRRFGVVLERGTPEDSARVDELMLRPPGSGWTEFGALLRVRCTDPTCQCQPDNSWMQGTWLHSVNECQVEALDVDAEVALW